MSASLYRTIVSIIKIKELKQNKGKSWDVKRALLVTLFFSWPSRCPEYGNYSSKASSRDLDFYVLGDFPVHVCVDVFISYHNNTSQTKGWVEPQGMNQTEAEVVGEGQIPPFGPSSFPGTGFWGSTIKTRTQFANHWSKWTPPLYRWGSRGPESVLVTPQIRAGF